MPRLRASEMRTKAVFGGDISKRLTSGTVLLRQLFKQASMIHWRSFSTQYLTIARAPCSPAASIVTTSQGTMFHFARRREVDENPRGQFQQHAREPFPSMIMTNTHPIHKQITIQTIVQPRYRTKSTTHELALSN